MFKAVISDIPLIRDSIDTVSQLISEGIFKIDSEGIRLKATDRAMVAVVDLKLDSKAFESFQIEGDKSIGLSIENLLQILKRAKSNDKIELESTEDGSKLNVKMIGSSTRKFSIPLLDLSESELPDITKLDYATKFQIKTPVMEEGIDDAFILSDSIVIEAKDGKLHLRTDGASSTSEMIVGSEGGLISMDGEDAYARYPLEYLKKMMKAGKISSVTSISLGKDFPLKMEFVSPEKCSISFVLAPRVEE